MGQPFLNAVIYRFPIAAVGLVSNGFLTGPTGARLMASVPNLALQPDVEGFIAANTSAAGRDR